MRLAGEGPPLRRTSLGGPRQRSMVSIPSRVLVCAATAVSLLAPACGHRNSPRLAGGSPNDTSSGESQSSGPSASADTVSARLVYRGSPDFFDPDGAFAPDESLMIGGYELAGVRWGTMEWVYAGLRRTDTLRLLVPPRASVTVKAPGDEHGSDYLCPGGVVSADTIALHCPTTPVGQIEIRGRFVNDFGTSRFSGSGPVMSARVLVTRDGAVFLNRVVTFTLIEGD